MQEPFTLYLNNKPLRFTPDGKVSVVDAIGATTHTNRAHAIWKGLKGQHPEILLYCTDYSFQGKDPMPVVDSTGWEMIMALLLYHFSNDDSARSIDELQLPL